MRIKNLPRLIEQSFRKVALEPAKIARARYHRQRASDATFIGVTGSSGKSTTSSMIAHLLDDQNKIFRLVHYNTFGEIRRRFQSLSPDIDFAVGELGVAGKGEMAPMAKLFQPDIAVVTLVANEHYSAFRGLDAVAHEKGFLVEALPESGMAILNVDDDYVMSMATRTNAKIVTFGNNSAADYQILNTEVDMPHGISVTLRLRDHIQTFRTNLFGEHFAVPICAAVATASELGLHPSLISERLKAFVGLSFRLSLHQVEQGPRFLIDSLKAPLHSLDLAFEVLANETHKGRKRIVLGTISDYNKKRRKVYFEAAKKALAIADEVIFVSDGVGGAPNAKVLDAEGRFTVFYSTSDAADYIYQTSREDDFVLVKSSSNLHLERLFMQYVHNQACWETICGKTENCVSCGLSQIPFADHPRHRMFNIRENRQMPDWYQQ